MRPLSISASAQLPMPAFRTRSAAAAMKALASPPGAIGVDTPRSAKVTTSHDHKAMRAIASAAAANTRFVIIAASDPPGRDGHGVQERAFAHLTVRAICSNFEIARLDRL